MKQKRKKLGRKLLSFLLTLAMVVGLMPGMGLTAYAATAYSSGRVFISNVEVNDIISKNCQLYKNNNLALEIYDTDGTTLLNSYSSSGYISDVQPGYYTIVVQAGKTVKIKKLSEEPAVTSVTLDKDTLSLTVGGETATLTASVTANYDTVKTVNWSSSDTSVATVNNGVITPVGAGGPVTIKATSTWDNTKYAECVVTVNASHTHSFTYAADGATITATCTAEGCDLPESSAGAGDHVATLTISANGGTYDGTTAYGATITDANSIQGDAKVQYQKKTDGSYGTATETAPTDAGEYKASITVGGATASVEYAIAQADPTANAPTGLSATYGQTLANVSLEGKNPQGNTPGTWAWADSTQSVGNVVDPATTFKATFTPDSSNYKTVENVEVSVTVSKAANPATVTGTATVIKGGNIVDLKDNVTKNGATGDVGYAIDGETKGCTLNGSVLTSGDTTGTVTVNVTVATDNNYNALAATPITVTISDKGTQTISAENVTVTYGDTDKKINASVTDPATGGGAISYAVKDESADYIDVNAATGALTIKKVPADGKAYVTVTAAGTAAYEQATKEVTVTINKAAPTVTAPTAKTLTYIGTAQELVNVGSATGGTMYYAVTTENTAPTDDNLYTTSIPTKTDAGTYYVWYRVVGDGFESSAGCVTVIINEEEKLKPGDIVVSEGDLVSEPVAETKYVTAEAAVNGEKLSVTICENFVNAIAYTGKKIDAVAHLNMSFDKTPIVSRFKIVDGSSVKPEDLIKVSYVQKYNKRANAAKKSKPTVYARIKVSKDAKKALSREDYKSLKKLVKKLNRELKKNQCNYRINQRSVTACEVKVVAKHGADGKIIVKNGKISGVKKVSVSIDVKDPKTGEITKNTFKLSKKDYSISDPDPENGTVRLTGKRNFTGTVTVKVE